MFHPIFLSKSAVIHFKTSFSKSHKSGKKIGNSTFFSINLEDFPGFFQDFSRIFQDFPGFSRIFPGFSRIFPDFLRTFEDSPGFFQISGGFLPHFLHPSAPNRRAAPRRVAQEWRRRGLVAAAELRSGHVARRRISQPGYDIAMV